MALTRTIRLEEAYISLLRGYPNDIYPPETVLDLFPGKKAKLHSYTPKRPRLSGVGS